MAKTQRNWNPHALWCECKSNGATAVQVWWFTNKLNTELPKELAIPLLGINLKEMKIYVHTRLAHTFIEASLIIAKQCENNPNVRDKQINSVLCPHFGVISGQ